MNKENLPIKKGKKTNMFKKGLSAFLAFIGISNGAYAQAKAIDEYKDDYNERSGYSEKSIEDIEEKYDKAFENLGISDKTVEDKVVDKEISDKTIEDKVADKEISDKAVEDKVVDKEISDKTIEDKIADKEISDKTVEDKGNTLFAELRENVNNEDLSQYLEDKENVADKTIEDKER